jgi:hypothetical protein
MGIRESVNRWNTGEGEAWFVANLPSLVSELGLLRDLDFRIEIEDHLWRLVNLLDQGMWGSESSEGLVEFAMDASLLLGDRELFQHFFDWLKIRGDQLDRHHAAWEFLRALERVDTLREGLPRSARHMKESLTGDVDIKWNSLSLVSMVDVAQDAMPLSRELPGLLESELKPLYEECNLNWFLDELQALDPNAMGWRDSRNAILNPIYAALVGEVVVDEESSVDYEQEKWEEHLDVLDSEGYTKPLYQIVNIAKGVYRRMQDRSEVWASLERGTALIKNRNQLDAYLASYGAKHISKLNCVLTEPFGQANPVRIVDWSCGQGLGTLGILESDWSVVDVKEVVLIEPSGIALDRAACIVGKHSAWQRPNLPRVSKLNGFLTRDTLAGRSFEGPTLHMFSNVLDIEEVDLDELSELIQTAFSGEQMMILVSPHISRMRALRLLSFQNQFSECDGFEVHRQIEKSYVGESASITARLFSFVL